MKHLTLLLALAFAAPALAAKKSPGIQWDEVACEKAVASSPSDLPIKNAYALAQQIEMRRIKANLEILTGEKLLEDGVAIDDREDPFARSLVRDILSDILRATNLKPRLELVSKGANIVAEIRGTSKPREVIELVAHYDSVGNPGADDNGSGVGLLLELARLASGMKFERTLRFVFTDLEEDQRQGAKGHIELLQGQESRVTAALIVDTIAWASKEKPRQLSVVEVGTPEMFEGSSGFKPQEQLALQLAYLFNRFRVSGTVDFSFETTGSEPKTADHGIYWKAGIPAVLIGQANETGLLNPEYHKASDRITNYNWDYYASVSKQIGGVAFALAGLTSDASPSAKIDALLADLEQTQVAVPTKIPAALARDPYKPAKTYSSGGGYQSDDLKNLIDALKKHDPKDFVVGLMPEPNKSPSTRRVFAVDFERKERWELIGLNPGAAEDLLTLSASLGVETLELIENEKWKKHTMMTVDTSRRFQDYYRDRREMVEEKADWIVRVPPAPKPEIVLTEDLAKFLKETGIEPYALPAQLVLVVLNQEVKGMTPFFIIDPASRGIIARYDLFSAQDVETLRLYLAEKTGTAAILLDTQKGLKDGSGLQSLALDFMNAFNEAPGAKKFDYLVYDESPPEKEE